MAPTRMANARITSNNVNADRGLFKLPPLLHVGLADSAHPTFYFLFRVGLAGSAHPTLNPLFDQFVRRNDLADSRHASQTPQVYLDKTFMLVGEHHLRRRRRPIGIKEDLGRLFGRALARGGLPRIGQLLSRKLAQ